MVAVVTCDILLPVLHLLSVVMWFHKISCSVPWKVNGNPQGERYLKAKNLNQNPWWEGC